MRSRALPWPAAAGACTACGPGWLHGASAGCMSLFNPTGALYCLLAMRADILCDADWVECLGHRGCGLTLSDGARVV